MLEYLYSILGLGGLAAAVWLAIKLQQIGAADQKEQQAKKAIEDANKVLNRTRTHTDRVKRVRKWRNKLR